MFNYLQQKPQVGIASGLGSGLIFKIQYLLTDDFVLKIVSGLATWAGFLVGFLTVVAWLIKIYQRLKPSKS